LKKALDEGTIHPATESSVVAITDLCDSKNKLEIVIAIPICSHKLSEIFERVIRHIVYTVSKINPLSTVVSLATDGDTNRRKTVNLLRSTQHDLNELKK